MGLPINFDPTQEPPRGSCAWRECKDTYVQGPYYNPIIDDDSGIEVTSEGYLRVCGGGGSGSVDRLYPGPGIAITGLSSQPTISSTGVIEICAGTGITLSCSNGIYTLCSGATVGSATPSAEGIVFARTQSAGTANTALGHNSLGSLTTGFSNVAVGRSAGSSLTTESNNVIIGNHPGVVAQNSLILFADGAGAPRLAINGSGALSNGTFSYGTAGQVLASNGPLQPFGWCTIPTASDTVSGLVELATTTETVTGTSATLAVTPAGAAGTYLPRGMFQAQGDLLSATGLCSCARLPVGAAGQFLGVNPAQPTGLQWQALPVSSTTLQGIVELATTAETELGTDTTRAVTPVAAKTTFISCSLLDAKGDLIVATADNTPGRLALGANNQYLTVDTSTGTGVKWTALPVASQTVQGIVELATNAETQTGTDATLAITPAAGTAVFVKKSDFTAKGQVLAATGSCAYSALAPTQDCQVLTANSACSNGVEWKLPPGGIFCNTLLAPGQVLTGGNISVCYVDTGAAIAPYVKYNPVGGTVCMSAKGLILGSALAPATATVSPASVGNSWIYLGYVVGDPPQWATVRVTYTNPALQVYEITTQAMNSTGNCALITICQLI